MIYNIYAVGDSLRNIRKKYGYTQNNMAESLGISYTHYSQIEQGRHRMSMQLMMKIVSKYGVDPNSLLGIQLQGKSTDEEILEQIFLKEAENTIYYYLFIVALETGMRLGELAGLQWKDIDFKKKVIHVRHSLTYFSKNGKYVFQMHPTKTNKGLRDIPLTAIAIDALHQQFFKKKRIVNQGKEPLEGYEDLVFVTKNNKPTTQFLVGECIEGIMRKIHKHNPDLIFERVTPHCFRHTFATRCLEANIPLKTVSQILGHSQLQLTTDLYMHVTTDMLFDSLEQFERKRHVG